MSSQGSTRSGRALPQPADARFGPRAPVRTASVLIKRMGVSATPKAARRHFEIAPVFSHAKNGRLHASRHRRLRRGRHAIRLIRTEAVLTGARWSEASIAGCGNAPDRGRSLDDIHASLRLPTVPWSESGRTGVAPLDSVRAPRLNGKC